MQIFDFNGYSLEFLILVGAVLLTVSVVASRISSRFGIPLLLIFLAIGMLAGSEGPGGIHFDDYRIAFAIGSSCLILIVFDGGLKTPWKSVQPILLKGISLSFIGTLLTGSFTAAFGFYVLKMQLYEALLLGAIVSSTDAAAVFGLLRSKNLSLQGSIKQTLEFEAASNDPVAIFLTVGVLLFVSNPNAEAKDFLLLLFKQAAIGFAFGYAGGRVIRRIINHSNIEYEGLYGVLVLGLVMVLFATAGILGGSGFLAVYIAGIILGNAEMLHKASITRFLDGLSWIAHILVFLTLGLLSFPSKVIPVWKEGLLLAFFMMFLARPLAVLLAIPFRGYNAKERVFISWVGLRGAAPIILATYPWSVHFPQAEYIFNLVFFVVISSVIMQGISIPWLARKLGITVPFTKVRSIDLAAGVLPSGFLHVTINIVSSAPACDKKIVDLGLPAGVILTSVEREDRFLIPSGETELKKGDHIAALARESNIDALKNIFGKITVTP